jgi:FixJ family two-component response regulator
VTEAINRGAIFKFLSKPWEDEHLRAQIHEAFVVHEAKQDKIQQARIANTERDKND